jgi:hypothetical protein
MALVYDFKTHQNSKVIKLRANGFGSEQSQTAKSWTNSTFTSAMFTLPSPGQPHSSATLPVVAVATI